jgi:hypothetical protein
MEQNKIAKVEIKTVNLSERRADGWHEVPTKYWIAAVSRRGYEIAIHRVQKGLAMVTSTGYGGGNVIGYGVYRDMKKLWIEQSK